ncbi:MAG TPA: IS630 family transposase [Candidatus Thermoplasmatota archaeon]|nr:IS630 family transposase [Candidatus Thermoplasmatota archaeon]
MKLIHLDSHQRQEIERRRHETHDKRVYERLSAVLWVAAGKDRFEVAALLGCSVRQVAEWLRIYPNQGLDALCAFHYKGDPGKLTPPQVERLKQEIKTGRFRNSGQIRQWVEEAFGVSYTPSGIKGLLRRIGASYHKVTGFFWKADPAKQRAFVKKYKRHKREAHKRGVSRVRRYCVDACHPIWGLDLVYYCWLLVGQQLLVGMGDGRKRLNILGAYCPDDQEYLDLRLTRDNINGEQFVNLLRLIRASHPEAEKVLLYVDGARYYTKPVVKEWLRRHKEFRLVPLPAYSPNLNLIERLWKFLRSKALSRWHKTFEEMQAAVSGVLDHLSDYRTELTTLMREEFAIVEAPARAAA